MALTEKQKLFVEEYLVDLNAKQAAIRAGYSPKTAEQIGYKLVQKSSVSEEIEKAMARRAKRLSVRQEDVINELKAIAYTERSSYAKVVEKQAYMTTEDGTRIPLTDEDGNPIMYRTVQVELTDNLSEDEKKAIAGIKMGKNGIEVETADKVRALELLGRHLGMFKEKVEVSGLDEQKNKLDSILKQMRGDD